MTLIFLVGRVIFGAYWLLAAYNHIFKWQGMMGYAQSKGVKEPKTAIIGTGVLLFIGGASLVLGVWMQLGILALIIFLLGSSFKMHAFWKVTDPAAKMGDQMAFNRNIAFIGALLMLLVLMASWGHYAWWYMM
jgi:uncharacterized membrane protein YphA (DoxX/SURF4 family)